jgi:hypothetical protein
MEHKKKEPWRIVLAILSMVFILFMWIKKDIVSIYTTMPKEQILPLILTTVAVTLLKVAGITAVLLLVK